MTWTRTGTPARAGISAAGRPQASPPTPVGSAKPRSSTSSREETGRPSRSGGAGAAVVDEASAAIAVPEFDAVGFELVVAQLDRLAQRVPALVAGWPGFI